MKDGVRAVIFCNPHNPIGKVWTKDEVETIGGLCAKYGAYMLSDEVHGDMVMDGNHSHPMVLVDAIQDKLVVYSAISKTFNVAGLHQSAIIIPNAEVRAKVDAMLKGAWIMGPNLMAFTAMEAAYTYGDKWVDEVVAYISDNVRYVQQQVRDFMPKVKLSHHEGTFLMWLDLRCLGMSSDELTVTLGREYGIGLGNGAHYGKQCDGFMRMNIACPRSTLEKGVAALKKCYLEREAK